MIEKKYMGPNWFSENLEDPKETEQKPKYTRKQSEEKIKEIIKEEIRGPTPSLLKDPELLEIIDKEFDKFIVDEIETRKAIFICGCGAFVQNLDSTFNVLTNGNSSAGKSWVTKNVLRIFPEDVFSKNTYRTKISPNALTYWHNSKVEPEWTWNGKILYLEDVGSNILNCDVFKVMISEGSTATIVGKKKGQGYELPATYDIEIIGKPITFLTTASGTPIEEIQNRVLLIDLDESEEQTTRILEKQTEWAIKGFIEEYDPKIKEALGHLRRVEVVIPDWIRNIQRFVRRKEILRWRREFPRFLTILKCSASLHQYQREKDDKGRIIVNEQDYEIARKIIAKVTTSSGIEGLTHRERRAYEIIRSYYKENEKGCSKAEIYAYKPIYSDRGWEKVLDKLANKGLLNVKLETSQETNRKASHFYPNEVESVWMPKYQDLIKKPENEQKELNEPLHRIEVSSDFPEIPRNNIISQSYSISSISSITIPVIKKGEVIYLDLEEGHTYPRSYFGDEPDKVIEMLEKEGKIKIF